MSSLFFICCVVILVFQIAVVIIRWLIDELDKNGLETLVIIVTTVTSCAVLSLKLPFVNRAIKEAVKPMFVNQDFSQIVYLLDFVVITTLFRMMFEHFVLHLQYKKLEWIFFSLVFLFFTLWTLRFIP
jgi:hypothetical protein